MRPIKLVFEGFMSYRTRHEIDFTDLNLFVITGQTGSGKSTIIDAMTYALFGRIPRFGTSPSIKDDITSQGLSNFYIEFTFSVSNSFYHIIRTKKDVNLYKLTNKSDIVSNNNLKLISSSVTDFNQKINTILNMDYTTFIKTIVLPQGEFDKFLKPDKPAERRKILIELAGLSVYDNVRNLIHDKRIAIQQKINNLNTSIQKEHSLANEEILNYKRDELENNRSYLTNLQTLLSEIDINISILEEYFKLYNRLHDFKTKYNEYKEKLSQIENKKQLLSKYKIANNIKPYFEQYKEVEDGLNKMKKDYNKHKIGFDNLKNAFQKAENDYTFYGKEKEKIVELKSRLESLDNHRIKAIEYNRLETESKKLITDKENFCNEITKIKTHIDNLEKENNNYQIEINLYDNEIAEKSEYLNKLELYKESTHLINKLEENNDRERTLLHSMKKMEEDLTSIKHSLEKINLDSEKQIKNISKQEEELFHIKNEYQKKQLEKASHFLKKNLQNGDICPVCNNTVKHINIEHSNDVVKNMTYLENKISDLESNIKTSHSLYNTNTNKATKYKTQIDNLLNKIDEFNNDINILKKEDHEIKNSLSTKLNCSFLDMDLKKIMKASEDYLNVKQLLEKKKETFNRLKTSLEKNNTLLAKAKTRLENNQENQNNINKIIEENKNGMNKLKTSFRKDLGVDQDFQDFVENEIRKTKNNIENISTKFDKTQKLYYNYKTEYEKYNTNIKNIEDRLNDIEKKYQNNKQKLFLILEENHFQDIEELKKCIISSKDIIDIEKDIKDFETNFNKIELEFEHAKEMLNRYIENNEILKYNSISIEKLANLKRDKIHKSKEIDKTNQTIGKLENEIKNIDLSIKKIKEFQETLLKIEEEYNLFLQIEKDLKSNNLQNFVVGRILEQIIGRGSEWLLEITDERYKFSLDDNSDLTIIDNWNAGEPRNIKTLSGGETFVTSLSLALALTDYLSQKAHLESLFIDEGFGSLDSEMLNIVADVIESLRHTGKVIGIITHIPELANRLPNHIHVDKKQNGSAVVKRS